jgi:hypothetical protein
MTRRRDPREALLEAQAAAARFNAANPIGTRVTLDLPRNEGGKETRTCAAARAVFGNVLVPLEGGAEVSLHRVFPIREASL